MSNHTASPPALATPASITRSSIHPLLKRYENAAADVSTLFWQHGPDHPEYFAAVSKMIHLRRELEAVYLALYDELHAATCEGPDAVPCPECKADSEAQAIDRAYDSERDRRIG